MDHRSSSAVEALTLIGQSRAKLAAASDTPPARHLAYAAMIGALVATPALPVPFLRIGVVALAMLAVPLVMAWDRRRSGMFVNGYRAGRTLWVTGAMLVVVGGLFLGSVWLGQRGAWTGPVLLGIAAGVVAYLGSVWWCRVFRRELLGEVA